MAVVLPVPAGARASWTRAPEVARRRTRAAWSSLRAVPFAVASARAIPTRTSVIFRPSTRRAASRTRLLGVEDPAGGVDRGAVDVVHALAVRPPQRLGLGHRVGRIEPHRLLTQRQVDDAGDGLFDVVGGEGEASGLSLGFGADVPHGPGRRDVPRLRRRRREPTSRGEEGATPGCRRPTAPLTISSTAAASPRRPIASARQAARWSASDRGSCLASRVSSEAC